MTVLKKQSFRSIGGTSPARILLTIAIVLNCLSDLTAQTRLIYNIDSLKRVLSTDLADTNRVWALNNLARNIRNTDSIPILTEQAIALSQKVGFPKGEAEAYNSLALWYNQNGNYPKALGRGVVERKETCRTKFPKGANASSLSVQYAQHPVPGGDKYRQQE
jgi:hypothetical protein